MAYIVTKSTKSKGVAAVLVFLFGGIGLFYASITGGIIMGIVAPIAIYLFLIIGVLTETMSIVALVIIFCCLYYILCLIWALNAVGNYNKRLLAGSYPNSQPSEYASLYPINQNEGRRESTILVWILSIFLIGTITYILYYKDVFSNSPDNKSQVSTIQPNDSISKKTMQSIDKKKTADNNIDQTILNNPKTTGWKVENEERYLIFNSNQIYMIYNGELLKTWHKTKSYTENEYYVTETKEGDEFLDFGGFHINYKSGRSVYYDGEDVPVKSIYIKEKYLK